MHFHFRHSGFRFLTRFAAIAIVSFYGFGSVAAETPTAEVDTADLDYDSVLKLARENAPTLIDAKANLRHATAHADAVDYWRTNPKLSVTSGPRWNDETDIDVTVGLFQELDIGDRSARNDVATAEARVAKLEVFDKTRAVMAAAANAFAIRLSSKREVANAEQNVAIADEIYRIANARSAAGDIGQIEISVATLNQARANTMLTRAKLRALDADTQLRVLTGLSQQTKISLVGDLGRIARTNDPPPETRSDVMLANAQVAVAERQAALAKRKRIPVFGIGVVGGIEERATVIKGVLEFTLPFFARGQGDLLQALERKNTAMEKSEQVSNQARLEIGAAQKRVALLDEAVNTFRDKGLTAARKTAKIATISYQSGATSLSELLILRRELFAAEQELTELMLLSALSRISLQRKNGALQQPISTNQPRKHDEKN